MGKIETIFQNYGAAICRDQLEERLRRTAHDGTELFYLLDRITTPENVSAIKEIKRALQKTYAGNLSCDAAREIAGKWFEDGRPA
jgi:hypothetical protein